MTRPAARASARIAGLRRVGEAAGEAVGDASDAPRQCGACRRSVRAPRPHRPTSSRRRRRARIRSPRGRRRRRRRSPASPSSRGTRGQPAALHARQMLAHGVERVMSAPACIIVSMVRRLSASVSPRAGAAISADAPPDNRISRHLVRRPPRRPPSRAGRRRRCAHQGTDVTASIHSTCAGSTPTRCVPMARRLANVQRGVGRSSGGHRGRSLADGDDVERATSRVVDGWGRRERAGDGQTGAGGGDAGARRSPAGRALSVPAGRVSGLCADRTKPRDWSRRRTP